MIVGIIIGLLVLVLLIIGIIFYLKHRAKQEKNKESPNQFELKDPNHKSESTLLNTSLGFFILFHFHVIKKTNKKKNKKKFRFLDFCILIQKPKFELTRN